MKKRTGHWEITAIANGVTVKLCNLAIFIRKYNYEPIYIYSQIAKAKKYKEDSTTIDGWKISWFYNDPLESLEKLVIDKKISTTAIIKQKNRRHSNEVWLKEHGLLPELVGRICYH
jgi:hypothetical protein